MTQLIALEKLTPLQVFSDNGLDPIIEQIEKQARAVLLDISTENGRKDIASLAYKIAQSKTALDKMGKDLVSGWKEQAKKVDVERARAWDRLEALQKEIRQPLTDWENQEKERVAAHEVALAAITEHPAYGQHESAAELAKRLEWLSNYPQRDWQEFAARATQAIAAEIERTKVLLVIAEKREAEAAELERLRREQAEREQQEREENIRQEAAAKAKAEAEDKARKEAETEAARVKAEQDKAEKERHRLQREREEADARAKKAEEDRLAAAAKAEADRKAAVAKAKAETEEKARRDAEAEAARVQAEQDRAEQERQRLERERAEADARAKKAEEERLAAIARAETDRRAAEEKAERDRLAAAEQAKCDADAAAQRERDRIEAEKKAEADATAKREADKRHRAKVNNEALDALRMVLTGDGLLNAGDASKAVVEAIAKGLIPHVKISY